MVHPRQQRAGGVYEPEAKIVPATTELIRCKYSLNPVDDEMDAESIAVNRAYQHIKYFLLQYLHYRTCNKPRCFTPIAQTNIPLANDHSNILSLSKQL